MLRYAAQVPDGNQLFVLFSLSDFLLHPSVMSHLFHITGAGLANDVEFELLIFLRGSFSPVVDYRNLTSCFLNKKEIRL